MASFNCLIAEEKSVKSCRTLLSNSDAGHAPKMAAAKFLTMARGPWTCIEAEKVTFFSCADAVKEVVKKSAASAAPPDYMKLQAVMQLAVSAASPERLR